MLRLDVQAHAIQSSTDAAHFQTGLGIDDKLLRFQAGVKKTCFDGMGWGGMAHYIP